MHLDDSCLIDDSREDMDALFLNPEFSDLTFVVGGERIHANIHVLAARCGYFRQGNVSLLLYGVFPECRVRCAVL